MNSKYYVILTNLILSLFIGCSSTPDYKGALPIKDFNPEKIYLPNTNQQTKLPMNLTLEEMKKQFGKPDEFYGLGFADFYLYFKKGMRITFLNKRFFGYTFYSGSFPDKEDVHKKMKRSKFELPDGIPITLKSNEKDIVKVFGEPLGRTPNIYYDHSTTMMLYDALGFEINDNTRNIVSVTVYAK